MILSRLLQKEDSTLTNLFLIGMSLDDDEAEIIASSLKHNTKLEQLNMIQNSITTRGCRAFLKLVNDISSIENTYNCNHTLRVCGLAEQHVTSDLLESIREACWDNRSDSPHAVGRDKIIKYQLNSTRRKKLCELQEIEYTSGNVFADIKPNLLPNILALIGDGHGQSELYTALVSTAPDLLSYIDRKALLTDELSKINDEYAIIRAKRIDLNKRLASLELGDSQQSTVTNDEVLISGKKRERS